MSESSGKISDEDSASEELNPVNEADRLGEVCGRTVVSDLHEGLYINIESGLGHLMNDEYGIKFKCGKFFTQAYRQPSCSGDAIHMCLRCFPTV